MRHLKGKVLLLYVVLGCTFFISPLCNGLLLAHGDGFDSYLPLRLFFANCLANFNCSLWLPHQLLGVPFIGILQSAVLYPLNWIYILKYFVPFASLFNLNILLHYVLGAWFMYLLCKYKLKLTTTSSIAAGLMWGFGSFNQAHRGHITIFNTAIWLPLLIYYTHELFENPSVKKSLLIALVLSMQILGGFIQVFLYTFIVLSIYYLVFFWQVSNKKKLLVMTVIALLLTLMIASPQLIQTLEYSNLSYRDKTGTDFITYLSYNPVYLITLIIPFIFGGGFHLSSWGYYSIVNHGLYIGLFPMICIVFALFRKRWSKYTVFAICLLCISGLFMLGKYSPLQQIVEQIPILGSMRLPSRHRYEFSFSLIMLAAIGLNYFLISKRSSLYLKIITFLLTITLISTTGIHVFGPKIITYLNTLRSSERQLVITAQVFELRSYAFLIPYTLQILSILTCALLYVKRPRLFKVVLILLLFVDLWLFAFKYDTNFPRSDEIQIAQDYYNRLLPDQGYRYWKVSGVQDNLMNITTDTMHSGGYDALINLDYKNLLNIDGRSKSYNLGSLLTNNSLLSMLSVRYILLDPERQLNLNRLDLYKQPGLDLIKPFAWMLGKEPNQNGAYKLHAAKNSYDLLSQSVILDPDTAYLFIAEISTTGKQSNYVYLDLNSTSSINDPQMPSQLILPEELSENKQQYFRVFITEKGDAPIKTEARIVSLSEGYVFVHQVHLFPVGQLGSGSFYKHVSRTKDELIIENTRALPRLYSVELLKPYEDMNDFKYIAYKEQPDFSKTAYIPLLDWQKYENKRFSKAVIHTINYKNDEISFRVDNNRSDSFIVLSDIYYPNWIVSIDGEEQKVQKTNGILRGVIIPKGTHAVKFKYQPKSLFFAMLLSGTTLLMVSIKLLNKKKSSS